MDTHLPAFSMNFANGLNGVQVINARIETYFVHNNDTSSLGLRIKRMAGET
jgi:hypothetical protein